MSKAPNVFNVSKIKIVSVRFWHPFKIQMKGLLKRKKYMGNFIAKFHGKKLPSTSLRTSLEYLWSKTNNFKKLKCKQAEMEACGAALFFYV